MKRPPTGALGPLNEKIVGDAIAARRETHDRTARLPASDFVRAVVHACTAGNEPCDDMIVEANVRALRDRSVAGLAKYGQTLDRDDLGTTDWVEHLRQELLDGANYAERLACDLSRVENRWRERERERFRLLVRRHWAKYPQGSPASLALAGVIGDLEAEGPGA